MLANVRLDVVRLTKASGKAGSWSEIPLAIRVPRDRRIKRHERRGESQEVCAVAHEDDEREGVAEDEFAYAGEDEEHASVPDAAGRCRGPEDAGASPAHWKRLVRILSTCLVRTRAHTQLNGEWEECDGKPHDTQWRWIGEGAA